jgi:hypothetical protein
MTIELPIDKDFDKSSNSSKDLWDQQEKSTIYVKDWGLHVIHSENCITLINCTCTPIKISAELEEKRKQWFEKQHKGIKGRKQEEQPQPPESDFFDPTMPKEDLGE